MKQCLFRQENVPVLQNQVYSTQEASLAVARGDICLSVDLQGVVVNHAFDPTRLTYGPGYDNSQQSSQTFRIHLDEVTDHCVGRFKGMQVFEIGAGDGSFVDRLRSRGVEASGCDPAADGRHPYVEVGSYRDYGSREYQALVLRHVLEHIPDPVGALRDLQSCFPSATTVYVEVPNLEWIISEKAWYDVTYEHVNYFTPRVLSDVFGGEVHSREMFNSQFIGVLADLRTLRLDSHLGAAEMAELNAGIAALQGARETTIAAIRELVSKQRTPVALWGMAGKGAMLLHALEAAGIRISRIVDINPNKWGKYVGRGLQISSVDSWNQDQPHVIVVSNFAYLDEIRSTGGSAHSYVTIGREGLVVT